MYLYVSMVTSHSYAFTVETTSGHVIQHPSLSDHASMVLPHLSLVVNFTQDQRQSIMASTTTVNTFRQQVNKLLLIIRILDLHNFYFF